MAKYFSRCPLVASLGKKQEIIDVPIVSDAGGITVVADATGTPTFDHTQIVLTAAALAQAQAAELILDYLWPDTADGTIQLYDSTDAVVVAETTGKTGKESSLREVVGITLANFKAGNTLVIRGNITAAGGAGEKVTLYRAKVRLVAYAIGANQSDVEVAQVNCPTKGLIKEIQFYCTGISATASSRVKKAGTAITENITPTAGTPSVVSPTDPFVNQGDALTVHVTTDASGGFTDLTVTIIVKEQEAVGG